jgi:hypothetical protein
MGEDRGTRHRVPEWRSLDARYRESRSIAAQKCLLPLHVTVDIGHYKTAQSGSQGRKARPSFESDKHLLAASDFRGRSRISKKAANKSLRWL